jgi:hypothetical protein
MQLIFNFILFTAGSSASTVWFIFSINIDDSTEVYLHRSTRCRLSISIQHVLVVCCNQIEGMRVSGFHQLLFKTKLCFELLDIYWHQGTYPIRLPCLTPQHTHHLTGIWRFRIWTEARQSWKSAAILAR